MRERDVTAPDGTTVRAWTHGNTGSPVLLCPGLGTFAEAWPSLIEPSAGLRVHSWYHRGTFGSSRPSDPTRITLADHVDDALAVLDDAGIDSCVVAGWSLGVSVAAELARRHPERVRGLLLIAGVPGDTFGAMFGMLPIPDACRAPLGRGAARALQTVGPVLGPVLRRAVITPTTVWPLRHSGIMLPSATPTVAATALRKFLSHDWGWYFGLALAACGGPPIDLSELRCPVTMLAGRYDLITDVGHVRRRMAAVAHGRLRVLPTTHFVPLEAPDEVLAELRLLVAATADPDAPGVLTTGSRSGT